MIMIFHSFPFYYYLQFDFRGKSKHSVCPLLFLLRQVEQSKVLIKEGGVQLLLTIVDTPGFGDAVDNSNW